ncbi:hypoxanthine phosphoribosyltransferase [bacterium]|nr:hypoxanthine phosphoribosyltransferase [bacterium]
MLTPRQEPLLTESQIRERIDQLAEKIVADLGTDKPFVLAGLLRGCFMFTADLVRALSIRGATLKELDFMVASSYGSGTESSRKIDIQRDLQADISGQRVLLVDDIIDTGHTLKLTRDMLLTRGPEYVKTVTLLDKPERREIDMEADYSCFSIPNLFVIGFGLDYDQKYRELPYITVMEEV